MLDAHSVSFVGGTISLHDDSGVPLRGLGIGSTRLLIARLQRKASERSTIILVDELEYGLEPHRIIRFINSLGSKEAEPPLQVSATSHSPVALSELPVSQLNVVRRSAVQHRILRPDPEVQGTVRTYPGAFLSSSIYVCEGASEVGLLRGLDQHVVAEGKTSLFASGKLFEGAIRDNTKLFILSHPHNPTGNVWSEDELRTMGEICLRHGVLVISDEIHQDLINPAKRHIPFALLGEPFAQNSITCTAPSKTFNLPGLQSANVFIPNRRIREDFQR